MVPSPRVANPNLPCGKSGVAMLKSDATTGTPAMAQIRAIYQSLRARSVTGVYPHANHAPAWALDYCSTLNRGMLLVKNRRTALGMEIRPRRAETT
jgi:hypothetical protein